MVGFSCYSWAVAYAFVKYEIDNPRTGEVTKVWEIVGGYQAVMFGMFSVITLQDLFPAVFRALTVGKQVLDVIERVPLIDSPKNEAQRVTQVKIADGINFDDVKFKYPTAPEHVRPVFEGASF